MKNKAFTLIELLVVIAIVGLLASIVLVNLTGQRQKARIAKGLQFSQSLHHALGAYSVGVWRFDECTTEGALPPENTAKDTSGYGNDGIVYGAICTADTPSGQGYALEFDGEDDYVNIGYVFNSKPSNYTISLWANKEFFVGAGGGLSVQRWWFSYNNYSFSSVNRYVENDTDIADGFSKIYASSDAFRYYTITDDGTQRKLYVNGELIHTHDNVKPQSGETSPMWINRGGSAAATWWEGVVDEVRIYEKALKTSQIESLYYAGLYNLLEKGLIDEQEYQERLTIK